MKGAVVRTDDYLEKRAHLAELSDEQLKERFWQLVGEIVDPMLELAKTHTTPSVERSVLLRMGFSSLEVKPLVEAAIDRGLINVGVGHIVYRIAKENNITIREAGLAMIDGKYWEQALAIFGGVR